jgi:hypothetical protein
VRIRPSRVPSRRDFELLSPDLKDLDQMFDEPLSLTGPAGGVVEGREHGEQPGGVGEGYEIEVGGDGHAGISRVEAESLLTREPSGPGRSLLHGEKFRHGADELPEGLLEIDPLVSRQVRVGHVLELRRTRPA